MDLNTSTNNEYRLTLDFFSVLNLNTFFKFAYPFSLRLKNLTLFQFGWEKNFWIGFALSFLLTS